MNTKLVIATEDNGIKENVATTLLLLKCDRNSVVLKASKFQNVFPMFPFRLSDKHFCANKSPRN